MSPENNIPTTPPRMQEANPRPNNEVEAPPLVPAKRRRFTIQEKFGLIRAAERLMDTCMCQRVACSELNIHHTMYGVWKKQIEVMAERKNIRSKSLCLGPVS
jgi:hypothetical protein